jgi:hypothetical protein
MPGYLYSTDTTGSEEELIVAAVCGDGGDAGEGAETCRGPSWGKDFSCRTKETQIKKAHLNILTG